MQTQVMLHIESLDKGTVVLEGVLPGRILELDGDPAIGEVGEVNYRLTAERKSNNILILGTVFVELELECARSGLFFSTKVEESAFLRDYSTSDLKGPLDLTEEIREAVVMNIPPYPVSPEAQSEDFVPPGIDKFADKGKVPDSWSALDDLNLS